MSLGDVFGQALQERRPLTLVLPCKVYANTEPVSWDASAGIAICRGGEGYTSEDHHYIRAEHIQAITYRIPVASPTERISDTVREAVRRAAGFPIGLMARPGVLDGHPEAFAEWLLAITAALSELCSRDPVQAALRSAVDQILLREGDQPAILGGSSLILEARPGRIPRAEELSRAIESGLKE
jgi:hypothetical protein